MRYTYLDYLAENKTRFFNTLGILTFLLIFLSIVITILLNNRTLNLDDNIIGVVSVKRIDTVQRKSSATYSSHNIYIPVVTISLVSIDFKLKPQFKHYQKQMLIEIMIVDILQIYYERYTNNVIMPVQIVRDKENI